MQEELKEFGLTDKEIKVYLACLKSGTALVQDIAKNAGTYRTYTYEILKSLKEKGLVSYVIKSGKQYFEVAEPEKLINILKEKENKIKKILPNLKELHKSSTEKPKVELYENKEGLKTILDDIINTKKEILVYGSTEKQLKILEFYFPNYITRRVKAKIHTRVITEKSPQTIEMLKSEKKEFRESRFILKFEFPTVTYIYGNKVAMISLEKEIIGLIIESKAIANTQKQVFELLWKLAKK
ncbi:hypothetical protein KAT36_03560 [Candidatus Pacearchaeota archaeon]|nr:hypothetical protein [Candidatus Pacearchaeota archaeon]